MNLDMAVDYLNWYFTKDNGASDKTATDAWEAIRDKLQPVKPIWAMKMYGVSEVWCGACRETLRDYSWKYCPRCGRKIKWLEV